MIKYQHGDFGINIYIKTGPGKYAYLYISEKDARSNQFYQSYRISQKELALLPNLDQEGIAYWKEALFEAIFEGKQIEA